MTAALAGGLLTLAGCLQLLAIDGSVTVAHDAADASVACQACIAANPNCAAAEACGQSLDCLEAAQCSRTLKRRATRPPRAVTSGASAYIELERRGTKRPQEARARIRRGSNFAMDRNRTTTPNA